MRRTTTTTRMLIVGLLVAAAGFGCETTSEAKTPPTTTAAPTTTEAPTTQAPATSQPTTTTAAPTTTAPTTTTQPPGFGPGTKLVGKDITPGRYTAQATRSCYWERLSGTTGGFDDILANDNITGQVVVDILETDVAFKTSGCARFTPYTPPAQPVTVFDDGVYVVGEQIAEGTYQSTTDPGGSCYWQRATGASGEFEEIVANDNVEGTVVVTVAAGEILKVNGCGTFSQ